MNIDSSTRTASPTPALAATAPSRFWTNWMVVWTEAVIAFGLALMVVRLVAQDLFWWVVYGSTDTPSGFTPEALDYQRWVTALTGALTAGWMVLVWFVVRHALARGQRWAWTAVVASIGTWFVLDSAASIALGFGENAILNVALVASVGPALLGTRPRA